jgi:hypothetical protein
MLVGCTVTKSFVVSFLGRALYLLSRHARSLSAPYLKMFSCRFSKLSSTESNSAEPENEVNPANKPFLCCTVLFVQDDT